MFHREPTIFIFGLDKHGWSIDQDNANTQFLLSKAGYKITHNIFLATHIWCVWVDLLSHPRYLWILLVSKLFHKKIIAVIPNDIRNNADILFLIKKRVDVCIAPSSDIENYLKMNSVKVERMVFYTKPEIFHKVSETKMQIAQELGVDYKCLEGKILIGSFQRDSLGSDLMQQKWQKNPELLIQILKKVEKDQFMLLLAGPRRHYVIRRCIEEHIPYLYIGDDSFVLQGKDDYPRNILSADKMNLLYNLIDIYLISSKSEGGPKAILEAGLAKTLVLSTRVGFASDILDTKLLYDMDNPGSAVKILQSYREAPEYYKELIMLNEQRILSLLGFENIFKTFENIFEL
jgi:hypothetical protein